MTQLYMILSLNFDQYIILKLFFTVINNNEQEIAQWVIDNRYPKSEKEKVSDLEMFYYLVDEITKLLRKCKA